MADAPLIVACVLVIGVYVGCVGFAIRSLCRASAERGVRFERRD